MFTHDIGSRLAQLRGTEPQADFAKKIGVHKNTWARWERGERALDIGALLALRAMGINTDWVLSGEGPQYLADLARPSVDSEPSMEEEELVLAPIYDPRFDGGKDAGAKRFVRGYAPLRRDWLAENGAHPGQLGVVNICGDAMAPTLCGGDIVIINRDVPEPIIDGIYVLDVNATLLARRLQRLVDGSIRVSSDNGGYVDEMVNVRDAENLNILGRIIWTGRWA